MTSLDHFHRCLHENCEGRVRLELGQLYRAFQEVHPELAATPTARAKLREYLDRLQLEERIELPKGQTHWDLSALPGLPNWIRLPHEVVKEEKVDLQILPWAPELRFLRSARVFVPAADLLKLQNFFARDGRDKPLVPIKERSLEIFGDEKRLDQLLRNSALFGYSRLNLESLRCFLVSEPLPWKHYPATDGPVLVIENAATWHSYCRWNEEHKHFSAIVYGCGNRFVDGIQSLREILAFMRDQPPVYYFGDLDPQGLLIPQEASGRAQAKGLPAIVPHLWSYRHLFAIGSGHGQCCEAELPPASLCDWLGPLAQPARDLFEANQRLAQEYLGWEFLQGVDEMD